MAEVKGMLMEAKGKKGIVMTKDGQFVQVRLSGGPVALGEEISAKVWQQTNWFKYGFIAAAFLLLFMLPGYHLLNKQAIAYVALDINPSIELAVDKNINIIKAQGLNDEGSQVVSRTDVSGMNLYEGLPVLVQQAIRDGYLAEEQDNVVLTTITTVKDQPTSQISKHKVEVAIKEPIKELQNISASVVIEESDMDNRDGAQRVGLSTGKYLLYQAAQEQGCKVTLEEVKNQNIQQLISKLPPGQQKKFRSIEQMAEQLPPGQTKKILNATPTSQPENSSKHKVKYVTHPPDLTDKNNKDNKDKDKDKKKHRPKEDNKESKDRRDDDKERKEWKDNNKEKNKKVPPGQLKKQQD